MGVAQEVSWERGVSGGGGDRPAWIRELGELGPGGGLRAGFNVTVLLQVCYCGVCTVGVGGTKIRAAFRPTLLLGGGGVFSGVGFSGWWLGGARACARDRGELMSSPS